MKGVSTSLRLPVGSQFPTNSVRLTDRAIRCDAGVHARAGAGWDVAAAGPGGVIGQPPPPPPESGPFGPVIEPRLMQYNEAHGNSVNLTGVVVEDPEVRALRRGAVVSVTLGVLARERVQRFKAAFWGKLGQQVAGNVTKGMQLAVTGYLSEFQNRVAINVQDFYVVDEVSGHPPETVDMIIRGSQQKLQTPGRSKKECYDYYVSAQMEPQKIARLRKIKEATVLAYIAECGAAGLPVDWGRLCSDARIGPQGSEYITADDIQKGVKVCTEDGDLSLEHLIVETRKVRNALMQIQGVLPKIQIQEGLMKGSGCTHAQIKIVLAMVIQGIGPKHWNEVTPLPRNSQQMATEMVRPPF